MAKEPMSAEDTALYTRLGQLASDGDALLRSGVSPAALKQQWIDSGLPEHLAGELVTMSQKFGKQQKRTSRRITAGLILAPFLLIGSIFGVIKIVQAVQGPSGYELANPIANAACGENGARLAEVDGQVVMTVGDALKLPGSLRTYDDGFKDLLLDDDKIVPQHVLCTDLTFKSATTCSGYYSQEVIDAVEASATLEEAERRLISLENGASLIFELRDGGRSVQVRGSTLTVKMIDVISNAEIKSTTVDVPADCPDTHYTNGYGSSRDERMYPTNEHKSQAVKDLLGITVSF